MNDSLRDSAFRAGVWQFLEQRAKAMKDQAKAELAQGLEAGDSVQGKWHGQPVAKATMSAGRRVVDFDEVWLLDWVKYHYPTEVETVEHIRPAFRKKLTDQATQWGAVRDSGGVMYDDGVEIRQGDPYISVRKADGAEEVIAELFRTGSVHLDGISAAALPPVVDAAHLDSMPGQRWVEPEVEPEVKPEPTDRYSQDREAAGL